MECDLEPTTKGCACVAKHRRANEVPGCFFTPEGEALWDRSFAAFCGNRGES